MATATLFPTSTTDTQSNISTGDHTRLDDGIAGDGAEVIFNQNEWSPTAGTGSAVTFGLTDAPGDFGSFTSIRCQVRARITGTVSGEADTADWIIDITGTNAPTNTVAWDETDIGGAYATREFTNSTVTPSAADIDGWSVRAYQSTFTQNKGPDGLALRIDEIELTLTYEVATEDDMSAMGIFVVQ